MAAEVFAMIFPVKRSNIASSQCTAAAKAKEIQSAEVVGFAQSDLIRMISSWEKLRSNNLPAVLDTHLARLKKFTKRIDIHDR